MAHRIALIGAAPSSDKLAPFTDASYEIWACSPGNFRAPRVDAWFEMHSLVRKWVPGNEPYIAALQQHPRVYVSAPDPRLPNAIIYPKDEVYAFFGNDVFLDTFFQSSVSFMLAMAIMQKPDTIGLWGIDMAAEDEYAYQRPGCHFFIREARARGIDIFAPPQSDILEPLPLYGYKEHNPAYWRQKARILELKTAVAECDHAIQQKQAERMLKQGALSDIKYTNQTWTMEKRHG